MDFYPTNPHTLRKLLAKRQTPCTQIFKQNPSTMDNQPKDNVNFLNKAFNNRKKRDNFSLNLNSLQKRLFNSKRLHSSISSDRTESMTDSTPEEVQPNTTDTFETIHKKIKISFHESSSRKVSFDNASEQSTTCDISSEGTPNIESHDCLSSPPLSSEPSRIIPMVRLDDENLKSSESVITNENPILVQDEPLITCPLKESFSQEKVKLRCNFRHKLKTPVSDATQIKCCKCEALLRKCQVYAAEKGGSCLNESYETMINFKCSKGHKWSVRYRNFDTDWCPECAEEKREEMREEFRKKCEEERKKRQKLEEEYQQRLFEEARRKFVNNINQRGPIIGDEDLAYFKKIDMEAEKLAKKNTEKYMSEKEASNNITFKQAFQVNKLLATPEGCLEKYMQSLDIETVKSEFRRIAKIIHPDKNKHPDAGIAFQKIHKVYEAVIGKVEGK